MKKYILILGLTMIVGGCGQNLGASSATSTSQASSAVSQSTQAATSQSQETETTQATTAAPQPQGMTDQDWAAFQEVVDQYAVAIQDQNNIGDLVNPNVVFESKILGFEPVFRIADLDKDQKLEMIIYANTGSQYKVPADIIRLQEGKAVSALPSDVTFIKNSSNALGETGVLSVDAMGMMNGETRYFRMDPLTHLYTEFKTLVLDPQTDPDKPYYLKEQPDQRLTAEEFTALSQELLGDVTINYYDYWTFQTDLTQVKALFERFSSEELGQAVAMANTLLWVSQNLIDLPLDQWNFFDKPTYLPSFVDYAYADEQTGQRYFLISTGQFVDLYNQWAPEVSQEDQVRSYMQAKLEEVGGLTKSESSQKYREDFQAGINLAGQGKVIYFKEDDTYMVPLFGFFGGTTSSRLAPSSDWQVQGDTLFISSIDMQGQVKDTYTFRKNDKSYNGGLEKSLVYYAGKK